MATRRYPLLELLLAAQRAGRRICHQGDSDPASFTACVRGVDYASDYIRKRGLQNGSTAAATKCEDKYPDLGGDAGMLQDFCKISVNTVTRIVRRRLKKGRG